MAVTNAQSMSASSDSKQGRSSTLSTSPPSPPSQRHLHHLRPQLQSFRSAGQRGLPRAGTGCNRLRPGTAPAWVPSGWSRPSDWRRGARAVRAARRVRRGPTARPGHRALQVGLSARQPDHLADRGRPARLDEPRDRVASAVRHRRRRATDRPGHRAPAAGITARPHPREQARGGRADRHRLEETAVAAVPQAPHTPTLQRSRRRVSPCSACNRRGRWV
jgi:hypothetical protein